MRAPDRLKECNRWVAAVVKRLSPVLGRIPVEPLGIAPTSALHAGACGAREVIAGLPPTLREITRLLLGKRERAGAEDRRVRELIEGYINTHLKPPHAIWNSIDRGMAGRLLATATQSQLHPLVTIFVLAKREFEARAEEGALRGASGMGTDARSYAAGR
jgi:hypothetical protein